MIMTKEQMQIEYDIKEVISNFKPKPYKKVKENLDLAAKKTRRALGVPLRIKKNSK
jgi:hypothetical protein